jgi:hypothetical protein
MAYHLPQYHTYEEYGVLRTASHQQPNTQYPIPNTYYKHRVLATYSIHTIDNNTAYSVLSHPIHSHHYHGQIALFRWRWRSGALASLQLGHCFKRRSSKQAVSTIQLLLDTLQHTLHRPCSCAKKLQPPSSISLLTLQPLAGAFKVPKLSQLGQSPPFRCFCVCFSALLVEAPPSNRLKSSLRCWLLLSLPPFPVTSLNLFLSNQPAASLSPTPVANTLNQKHQLLYFCMIHCFGRRER